MENQGSTRTHAEANGDIRQDEKVRLDSLFVALPPDLLDLKPDAILAASPLAVAHAWKIRVVPEPTQKLMGISARMRKFDLIP